MKGINLVSFVIAAVLTLALSGCDKNMVFDKNVEIENGVWNKDKKISFKIDITDTVTPNNVYINLRHEGDYQWSNIYLFLNTTFPNGEYGKDTIECILSDNKGKWLGSGIGDIKSNQMLFMKNIRFKQGGTYTFELQQAMRSDDLQGILDIGMRIEKAVKK